MKFNNVQKQTIVNRYNNGETLKELAAAYGCSSPTIAKVVKKEGGYVRGRGRRPKVTPVASAPVPTPNTSNLDINKQSELDKFRQKIIGSVQA